MNMLYIFDKNYSGKVRRVRTELRIKDWLFGEESVLKFAMHSDIIALSCFVHAAFLIDRTRYNTTALLLPIILANGLLYNNGHFRGRK
jgi:hypothetical protein